MSRQAEGDLAPEPDGTRPAPIAAPADAPLPADPAGWQVISASGEIDLFAAPELRDRFLATVTAGHRLVIIDLSDVTFMDSSGLAVLVTAYKRLLTAGGRLRVSGAGSATRSALAISGLDRIIETYPDLDTARADGDG
jgi:anti-sigma B factor antagonist